MEWSEVSLGSFAISAPTLAKIAGPETLPDAKSEGDFFADFPPIYAENSRKMSKENVVRVNKSYVFLSGY